MRRKALMGVEHLVIVGIALLLLTSTVAPQRGNAGRSTDIRRGGDTGITDTGAGTTADSGADTGSRGFDTGGDTGGGGISGIGGTGGSGSNTQSGITESSGTGGQSAGSVASGGSRRTSSRFKHTDLNGEEHVPRVRVDSNIRLFSVEEQLGGKLRIRTIPAGWTVSIPVASKKSNPRFSVSASHTQDASVTMREARVTETAAIATSLKKKEGRFVYDVFELSTSVVNPVANLRFTVVWSWIERLAGGDARNVVLSRLKSDGVTFDKNVPTRLIYITYGPDGKPASVTYSSTLTHFSLFVINAHDIVKGPSLCNNDGVCSYPETEATCPLDCRTEQHLLISTCNTGETTCIGKTTYTCVSGKYLKSEVCDAVCDNGACVSVPATSSLSVIFIAVLAALVVVALTLSLIFLRG